MKNKFVIIEITQSKFSNDIQTTFSVPYEVNHGYNTHTEAKKKLDALLELTKKESNYQKVQYKIIQIPFNSAFNTPKLTA